MHVAAHELPQPVIEHEPDPEQLIEQLPPAQLRLAGPEPEAVTEHPPCGQANAQGADPVQLNEQPRPTQVYSHAAAPVHRQTLPGEQSELALSEQAPRPRASPSAVATEKKERKDIVSTMDVGERGRRRLEENLGRPGQ